MKNNIVYSELKNGNAVRCWNNGDCFAFYKNDTVFFYDYTGHMILADNLLEYPYDRMNEICLAIEKTQ